MLAASLPRDAADDAIAATGRGARRRGGKLLLHVMVYFAIATALFAEDDYEEVAAGGHARLVGVLGCLVERADIAGHPGPAAPGVRAAAGTVHGGREPVQGC